MAAYPMVQAPKLGEFIEKLTSKYGVTLEESKSILEGPRGLVTLRHLKRIHEGKTLVALLPEMGLDERISIFLVRPICVQLRIPPADFGFVLDRLPEES